MNVMKFFFILLLMFGCTNFYTGTNTINKNMPVLNSMKLTSFYASDVHTLDEYSYIISRGGFKVVDVRNPQIPVTVFSESYSDRNLTNLRIQGNYAYIIFDNSTIKVMDITKPSMPLEIASLYMRTLDDIFVQGNYLYSVSGFYNELSVIDISSPKDIHIIKSLNVQGIDTVYVKDNYAYISYSLKSGNSIYERGIKILDISDSNNPVITGTMKFDTEFTKPQISGNYLYIVLNKKCLEERWPGELNIIDITNPAKPSVAATTDINGFAENCHIKDKYAYIVHRVMTSDKKNCGSTGMTMVDISNPQSPSISSFTRLGFFPENVYVQNNHAYVANHSDGLTIMDVTDARTPYVVGNLNENVSVESMKIKDSYMYLVGDALKILDITNPAKPVFHSSMGNIPLHSSYSAVAKNFAFKDNYLYIPTKQELKVIDISSPKIPLVESILDLENKEYDFYGIAVKGNYAFITDDSGKDSGTLKVIDITNPKKTSMISSTPFAEHYYPYNICIKDNYAYITTHFYQYGAPYVYSAKVEVFDISDPKSPVAVKSLDFNGSLKNIAMNDKYACVGVEEVSSDKTQYYLKIIDITNPGSPVIKGSVSADIKESNIAIQGNYAYVAGSGTSVSRKLLVINITNPDKPVIVKSHSINTSYENDYVCVNGNYAYVWAHDILEVVDISEFNTKI